MEYLVECGGKFEFLCSNDSDAKMTVVIGVKDNCKNDGEYGAEIRIMKKGPAVVKTILVKKAGGIRIISLSPDEWIDFYCKGEKADKTGCTVNVEVK